MSRVELPDFIREVFDDVARRNVLVACCLAVFAVGLVPHLLAPGLPSAQEAVRQRPEIQNLFLLLAFTSTATILIGGLVSDIYRHRSLMVGGLFLMMVGAALCIVIDFGPLFYVANFASDSTVDFCMRSSTTPLLSNSSLTNSPRDLRLASSASSTMVFRKSMSLFA